jgi:hypothetical protein
MDWSTLFYFLGAGLMVWLIVRMVRRNPASFSKENLSKSVYTLGLLALMLIGVIFLCVMILKTS